MQLRGTAEADFNPLIWSSSSPQLHTNIWTDVQALRVKINTRQRNHHSSSNTRARMQKRTHCLCYIYTRVYTPHWPNSPSADTSVSFQISRTDAGSGGENSKSLGALLCFREQSNNSTVLHLKMTFYNCTITRIWTPLPPFDALKEILCTLFVLEIVKQTFSCVFIVNHV